MYLATHIHIRILENTLPRIKNHEGSHVTVFKNREGSYVTTFPRLYLHIPSIRIIISGRFYIYKLCNLKYLHSIVDRLSNKIAPYNTFNIRINASEWWHKLYGLSLSTPSASNLQDNSRS